MQAYQGPGDQRAGRTNLEIEEGVGQEIKENPWEAPSVCEKMEMRKGCSLRPRNVTLSAVWNEGWESK